MTNDEKIARLHRAEAICGDPLMVEAHEHIEAELWRLFKELKPTAHDELAEVKAMQYVHDKFRAFFLKVLQDGKIAKYDVERARPRPPGY